MPHGNGDNDGSNASGDESTGLVISGGNNRASRKGRRNASAIGAGAARDSGSESGSVDSTIRSDDSIEPSSGSDTSSGSGSDDSSSGSGDSGSGTGSGSGSGSGEGNASRGQPTDRSGKRGRHPRECTCDKCEAKRRDPNAIVRLSGERKPRQVRTDEFTNDKKLNAKALEEKAISLGLDVLFEIPKHTLPAGTADHWPLTDDERGTLAERIQDVMDMLPKKTHSKMAKTLSKVMPPLGLIATAFVIVKPRVDHTRLLIARKSFNIPPHANPSQERSVTDASNTNAASRDGNSRVDASGGGSWRSGDIRIEDGIVS